MDVWFCWDFYVYVGFGDRGIVTWVGDSYGNGSRRPSSTNSFIVRSSELPFSFLNLGGVSQVILWKGMAHTNDGKNYLI